MIQGRTNVQIAMFNAKHVSVLHKHNVYLATQIGYSVEQLVTALRDFIMT